jgi:hypothetical protein
MKIVSAIRKLMGNSQRHWYIKSIVISEPSFIIKSKVSRLEIFYYYSKKDRSNFNLLYRHFCTILSPKSRLLRFTILIPLRNDHLPLHMLIRLCSWLFSSGIPLSSQTLKSICMLAFMHNLALISHSQHQIPLFSISHTVSLSLVRLLRDLKESAIYITSIHSLRKSATLASITAVGIDRDWLRDGRPRGSGF